MNIDRILTKISDDSTRCDVAQLHNENVNLREQINSLNRRFLGKKSERLCTPAPVVPLEALFNEAEALAKQAELEKEQSAAPLNPQPSKVEKPENSPTKKAKTKFSESLKRVEVVHDLEEAEKTCSCGSDMNLLGEEIVEKLGYKRSETFVRKHIYLKYACTGCKSQISTPKRESGCLKSSKFEPGILAWLLASKYSLGLPLYRLESELKSMGAAIPRVTLARNVIACAEVLKPIYLEMRKWVLSHEVVAADETRVQVLKGKKPATSDNFMWVLTTHPWSNQPAVIYHYHPERSQAAAKELLHGFKGKVVQSDGYSGYGPWFQENKKVKNMGCPSHARRKFEDAHQSGSQKGKEVAGYFIDKIRQLFLLERELKSLSESERLEQRKVKAPPILQEIRRYLSHKKSLTPPNTKLGRAMTYLFNQWEKLQVFLENGNVPLSNNGVENCIRPFAVGRRAWLFSTSVKGAETSAILYSLAVSAKLANVPAHDYFEYVLEGLSKSKNRDPKSLMPWNVAERLKAEQTLN